MAEGNKGTMGPIESPANVGNKGDWSKGKDTAKPAGKVGPIESPAETGDKGNWPKGDKK